MKHPQAWGALRTVSERAEGGPWTRMRMRMALVWEPLSIRMETETFGRAGCMSRSSWLRRAQEA